MDLEDIRMELPVGAKLLLQSLVLVNGELDQRSVELVRLVGEEMERSREQYEKLCDDFDVKYQCGIIRSTRKTSVQSLANLIQKQNFLQREEDNSDAVDETSVGVMEEECSLGIAQSITDCVQLVEKLTNSLEKSKRRCDDLASIASQSDTRHGHLPLICHSVVQDWSEIFTNFCDQIWQNCHQISPQDVGQDAPYEHPKCKNMRENLRIAMQNARGVAELSLQFIHLTAEIHSKAVLKDALTQLDSHNMNWENFTKQGEMSESAILDLSSLDSGLVSLFNDRANAECRTVERMSEQAIAETLLGQLDAITKSYDSLVQLAPLVQMWNSFLRGQTTILKNSTNHLSILEKQLDKQKLLLAQYSDHLSSFSASNVNQETLELTESADRIDDEISTRLTDCLHNGSGAVKMLSKRVADINEMSRLLTSFRTSDALMRHEELLGEMTAVLRRAKYVLETTADQKFSAANCKPIAEVKPQPNATGYFTPHSQEGRLTERDSLGSPTRFFSPVDVQKNLDPEWEQLSEVDYQQSPAFYDSLNVTPDISDE